MSTLSGTTVNIKTKFHPLGDNGDENVGWAGFLPM